LKDKRKEEASVVDSLVNVRRNGGKSGCEGVLAFEFTHNQPDFLSNPNMQVHAEFDEFWS